MAAEEPNGSSYHQKSDDLFCARIDGQMFSAGKENTEHKKGANISRRRVVQQCLYQGLVPRIQFSIVLYSGEPTSNLIPPPWDNLLALMVPSLSASVVGLRKIRLSSGASKLITRCALPTLPSKMA